MKTMLKLAVLCAALLLLTGIAFAQGDCECYKITYTNLDNPTDGGWEYDEICLDYENYTGTLDICDISLFPGLITQALLYDCPCVGYFKFHGSDNNVVIGEEYCEDLERYTFWGHITDYENCNFR